jgi:hypothetical protein
MLDWCDLIAATPSRRPDWTFTGAIFGGIIMVVIAAVVLCLGDFVRKRGVAEFNGSGTSKHDETNEYGSE